MSDGAASDPALRAQARALLDDARAWLEEWLEEGVERVPAPADAAEAAGQASAAPLPSPAAREEAAAPAPSASVPAGARGARAPAATPADRSAMREAPPGAQSSLLDAPPAGPRPSLEAVREKLGECTRCPLHEGRRTIVFGDGNPDAEIMFIGEGPGEQEDLQGLPFVGRAGELLTRMIERGLGIARADVYICNIVKCRPPGNRTPLAHEVSACRPFLDGQIDAVRPRVIVTLGKPASSLLLGREISITRVRGTWHQYRGIPVMPTFHPAFILRQYTEQNRRLVWQDLKAAHARAAEGGGAEPA